MINASALNTKSVNDGVGQAPTIDIRGQLYNWREGVGYRVEQDTGIGGLAQGGIQRNALMSNLQTTGVGAAVNNLSIDEEFVPPGRLSHANSNAIVRFFEIDLTRVGAGIHYFHPGLNEFGKPVVWGGKEYHPFPIQIEGLEYNGQGRMPRPELTVSNVAGQLGKLVRQYKDLNGCILVHRMTLACFLDSVNFIDGNLDANPVLEFPKEIFIFERKAEETLEYIKFELASALDLEGQKLPKRNYNANWCTHEYCGPLCGWDPLADGWKYDETPKWDPGHGGDDDEPEEPVGKYFDANDKAVTDKQKDECGRRLRSCEARFGRGGVLPFGGFPGVGLIANY